MERISQTEKKKKINAHGGIEKCVFVSVAKISPNVFLVVLKLNATQLRKQSA